MPLCQFCGGNYQRLPTHYTMSDCRPQYNAYIARLTTAIVLIDIPPAYKLGQIGEDRPEYEYHNHEEELNSSEEEDGNIARVAQVEQIDGEYHEDDTAGMTNSTLQYNSLTSFLTHCHFSNTFLPKTR